jgi:hypothetical protein
MKDQLKDLFAIIANSVLVLYELIFILSVHPKNQRKIFLNYLLFIIGWVLWTLGLSCNVLVEELVEELQPDLSSINEPSEPIPPTSPKM